MPTNYNDNHNYKNNKVDKMILSPTTPAATRRPQHLIVPPIALRHQMKTQISEEKDTSAPSTVGAVDYRPPPYQLRQMNITSQPSIHSVQQRPTTTQRERPISRPHIYKQPMIMQRYSPGEAVASQQFKNHIKTKNSENKHPAASSIMQSFVPPKDLYSFPPNIDAKYPPPAQDPKASLPGGRVNSYLAPPSGPLTSTNYDFSYPLTGAASSSSDNGYKYKDPASQWYLPPPQFQSTDDIEDEDKDNDVSMGVLPASAMDGDGDHFHMLAHGHNFEDKEYPTPPPGWLKEHPKNVHAPPNHSSSEAMDDGQAMVDNTMIDTGNDQDNPKFNQDHDQHYMHHHHYPELIFDDHVYYHHDQPPSMTTPTPPTSPPPPLLEEPEPRVKKYSYFYIGRKLWYIPLYFTVWFSFYVLWLIIKSIARHKVNLPNHYVARRSASKAENSQMNDYINKLTIKVLNAIEQYSSKQYN